MYQPDAVPTPDNHTVALIKLHYVVAGIYMCVYPRAL
jgi:hypothetical protein